MSEREAQTGEYDELVQHIRKSASIDDAADAIEALTAENERLRAALETTRDEARLGFQRTLSKSRMVDRFQRIFHRCEMALSPKPEGQDNSRRVKP